MSPSKPTRPQPDECCQSGCVNCVWIDYTEQLLKYHKDKALQSTGPGEPTAGEQQADLDQVRREIEREVEDPSVKAYLLSELNMRRPRQQ